MRIVLIFFNLSVLMDASSVTLFQKKVVRTHNNDDGIRVRQTTHPCHAWMVVLRQHYVECSQVDDDLFVLLFSVRGGEEGVLSLP